MVPHYLNVAQNCTDQINEFSKEQKNNKEKKQYNIPTYTYNTYKADTKRKPQQNSNFSNENRREVNILPRI